MVERFNLRQIKMETGQHVRKCVSNLLETAENWRKIDRGGDGNDITVGIGSQ